MDAPDDQGPYRAKPQALSLTAVAPAVRAVRVVQGRRPAPDHDHDHDLPRGAAAGETAPLMLRLVAGARVSRLCNATIHRHHNPGATRGPSSWRGSIAKAWPARSCPSSTFNCPSTGSGARASSPCCWKPSSRPSDSAALHAKPPTGSTSARLSAAGWSPVFTHRSSPSKRAGLSTEPELPRRSPRRSPRLTRPPANSARGFAECMQKPGLTGLFLSRRVIDSQGFSGGAGRIRTDGAA